MTRRAAGGRRHKYGARATVVDGIRFDSAAEARRYQELRLRERAGEIRDLTRQVGLTLFAPWLGPDTADDLTAAPVVGVARRVGTYRADFRYILDGTGDTVYEDVKGYDTPLSGWKRRHVEVQHGIVVHIIGTPRARRPARSRPRPRRRTA